MAQGKKRIDITPIEQFDVLFRHEAIMKLKRVYVETDKKKKKHKRVYYVWNQLCTSMARARNTADYLNELVLTPRNFCGEAFNFYEFLDCSSIIFECVAKIFEDFGVKLSQAYDKEKVFRKSNPGRAPDIKFFRFVRSACAVHPESTNQFIEVVKRQHEFYPYAAWNDGSIREWEKTVKKDCDIVLSGWNSLPSCFYKNYCLYLDEFYTFLNKIISCLTFLEATVRNLISAYQKSKSCRKIESEETFKDRSSYCLYLRDKIFEKNSKRPKMLDGGLLICSHLLSSPIIGQGFKNVIFASTLEVRARMTRNLEQIESNDAYAPFMDLASIAAALKADNLVYISGKLSYLEEEAKKEVENDCFRSVMRAPEQYVDASFANAKFVADKLLAIEDLIDKNSINTDTSFADLFELLLQTVWEKQKSQNKPMEERENG